MILRQCRQKGIDWFPGTARASVGLSSIVLVYDRNIETMDREKKRKEKRFSLSLSLSPSLTLYLSFFVPSSQSFTVVACCFRPIEFSSLQRRSLNIHTIVRIPASSCLRQAACPCAFTRHKDTQLHVYTYINKRTTWQVHSQRLIANIPSLLPNSIRYAEGA